MTPELRRGLLIALAILIADQASKLWVLYGLGLPDRDSIRVLPFLALTFVWNDQISMGIPLGDLLGGASGGRFALIAVTLAVSLYVAIWLRRSQRQLEMISLAAVLGGAIGNVTDRIAHGAVVDFIHVFGFGYHFYVFNVADAAITLGVVGLLVDTSLQWRADKRRGDKGHGDLPSS